MRTYRTEYVPGLHNAEDLARVPGSGYLVAGGLAGPGHPRGNLHLVSLADRSVEPVYPAAPAHDPDPALTAPPPDPDLFAAHGIALRPGPAGVHTLYQVNHGGRESVEIFRVDARGARPALTWTGAVVAPEGVSLNDVAPHPDGGFLVTNTHSGGPAAYPDLIAGEATGCVFRWRPGDAGMAVVPGSERNSPNGIEVAPDGTWCVVALWRTGRALRLPLDGSGVPERIADLPMLPDNLTWTEDGRHLLVAGQLAEPERLLAEHGAEENSRIPFAVARVDPRTLAVEVLAEYDDPEVFGCGTTALQVGEELWIGSARAPGVLVLTGLLGPG